MESPSMDKHEESQNLPTRTVSARLTSGQFTVVNEYCKRAKINPSTLIKELLFEEITPDGVSIPANVAGRNILEYDKKRDAFTWSVELDNSKRVEILKNISPEYLSELNTSISSALTLRSELQGKRKRNSVPIPRRMIKGRK